MIRILFTAAEQEELDCAQFAVKNGRNIDTNSFSFDFMLTGIGTTSTCYRLTKKLLEAKCNNTPYNLVINIGIAGSFDMDNFPLGAASIIEKEYFGDLGFETMFGFQTLFQYDLLDADSFPYNGGALVLKNMEHPYNQLLDIAPKASAITVQTVTGDPNKVEAMYKKFNPQIESMEGAAFYYVCLSEKVNFFELRTVSNRVGERDKSKWNIPLALDTLTRKCTQIVEIVTKKH